MLRWREEELLPELDDLRDELRWEDCLDELLEDDPELLDEPESEGL